MLAKKMKRVFVVLLVICTLLTQGSVLAFAAETDKTGVSLQDAYLYGTSMLYAGEQGGIYVDVPEEFEEYTVAWSVADESILTIDQNGTITGIAKGVTTVYAQIESGKSSFTAEMTVQVFEMEVSHIALNYETAELNIGETLQLTAEVQPSHATNKVIEWCSKRPDVVSVDENGLVTAKKAGDACIVVKSTDDSGALNTCWIRVLPENYPNSGVQLYKNDVIVGNYATINDAFDLMTDKTADYVVVLCDGQILEGYPQWPRVNSIKITCALSTEEYGNAIPLVITENVTTFQSDVIFSDWICVQSYTIANENKKINIQNYQLTFTEEFGGHIPYLGWSDIQHQNQSAGFDIVGDVGSKVLVEATTQTFFSSFDVDVLEVADWAQENGHSTGLIMAGIRENCEINTYIGEFEPVLGLEVSGSGENEISFTIGDVEFLDKIHENAIYTPTMRVENAGEITVEVKDMPAEGALSFQYVSKESAATGSFSYTGTTAPKSIDVSIDIASEGSGSGLREGDSYQPFERESLLLYAPFVSSDAISFGYWLQGDCNVYDMNMIYGAVRLNGSFSGENGYYYTSSLPVIVPSQSVVVFGEDTTKTLLYTGANTNGNLKSVTWTAESTDMTDYSSKDTTSEIIGAYDEDSLEITYSNRATNVWTTIKGVFDYGNAKVSLEIPLVPSVPVSNASFSKDKIETVYCMFNYQEIELDYNANGTPAILLSCSDYSVVSNLSISDNIVSFYVEGIGTAIIRAYVGDEIVECEVVVTSGEVSQIKLNKSLLDLKVEDSYSLIATVLPEEAFIKDVTWTTSNKNVAIVDANGKVTAVGVGTVTITATAKDGSGVSASCTVTVKPVLVSVITLNKTSVNLFEADTVNITATVAPTNAENKAVTWTTSNKNVATVDANGKVTAVGVGTATITATAKDGSGVKASCTITVKAGYPNGINEYTDGKLYYFKDNQIDTTYNGLADYKGDTLYVKNGAVDTSANGLKQVGSNWYLFKAGKVNRITTLELYAGTWWYVENGQVNFGYDGVADYSGKTWYIENGQVDFGKNGLLQRGTEWYYFKGGAVDTGYTGLTNSAYGWWYINKGEMNFDFTGLTQYGGSWWYVSGSHLTFDYDGVAEYGGSLWYLENSQVDFGKNGLLNRGDWYYFKGGKVDTSYTGLTNSAYGWWYIDKGEMNFDYTGLTQYGGSWWYVSDSHLTFNYDGVAEYGGSTWYLEDSKVDFGKNGLYNRGDWYYFKGGAVDYKFTGLTNSAYGWWYIEKGKVTFDFTDLVYYGGSWWYVENSNITFKYDGVVDFNGETWYLEDSKVDFGKSGLQLRAGTWYLFDGGKVNRTTTLAYLGGNWWYVEDGEVDFTANTIIEFNDALWYVKNGQVDFGYNGTYEFEGGTYNVVNGQATLAS